MRVATIRKIVAVFGLTFEGALRGLGADADRLLDERHAALLGACAEWLGRLGWRSVSEVSYSEWGERGSVDVLAWHESTANLLVVEIKTELASVEATLRKHDEKVRLGPAVAAKRFGWQPTSVGRLLVFPDERTERRRVAAHASVLDGAYPLRAYDARRWCRSPSGPMAGVVFLPDSGTTGRMTSRSRQGRVRVADQVAPRPEHVPTGQPSRVRPDQTRPEPAGRVSPGSSKCRQQTPYGDLEAPDEARWSGSGGN